MFKDKKKSATQARILKSDLIARLVTCAPMEKCRLDANILRELAAIESDLLEIANNERDSMCKKE